MKLFLALLIIYNTNIYAGSLCIGHRGNRQVALENSMAAIKSGVDIGADGVEFDVHHTKDGIGIIMHDADLSRTGMSKPGKDCSGKNIDKLTYREIQENCILKNGEEIPLFEDFLSYLASTKVFIFIEFKDFPSYHSLELIQKYLSTSPLRVRFISFKKKNLDQAYNYTDKLPALSLMKAFHVYPFFKKAKNKYGIDVRFGAKRVRRMMGYPEQESGAWTVDDTGDIMWLESMGVNFITTNNPAHCMEITHR